MTRILTPILAALTVLAPPARAEVRLAEIFGSGMVLQRGTSVPVWGWAEPGATVLVALQQQSVSATADAQGRWTARLSALEAGGPFEMVVQGPNKIVLGDVFIGEVWLCAGQSNLGWPLELAEGGATEAAKARWKHLRWFKVTDADAQQPREHLEGAWNTCNSDSARGFSAVAYWFAKEIESALEVPIGIIECSAAGTPAEVWTDRAALERDPALAPSLRRWARKEKSNPGARYNAMIAPLAPFAIRGVVWYQGESNVAFAGQYQKLFPTLIASWRARFGQGDFPFLFVQLPGFGATAKAPGPSAWAELREAQAQALALPNTAMAIAIDLGAGDDLHPPKKREVGERLARIARARVYGQTVPSRGPTFGSFAIEGKTVRVRFTNAEGLRVRGGGKPNGFALAGADKRFVWADAKIEDESVVLRAPAVAQPIAVRFLWSDEPESNLENAAGLPAEPFRTDDWSDEVPGNDGGRSR